jgi:hypothetical protein
MALMLPAFGAADRQGAGALPQNRFQLHPAAASDRERPITPSSTHFTVHEMLFVTDGEALGTRASV